jgi:hypothetical protein
MVNKVGNLTNASYTLDAEFTTFQRPILHVILYSPDKHLL